MGEAWRASSIFESLASFTVTAMAQSPPVQSRFPNMPDKLADLDQTWAYLVIGVDHIMTLLEAGLSFMDYTNFYSAVYNYCTSTRMHSRMETGNRSVSFNS